MVETHNEPNASLSLQVLPLGPLETNAYLLADADRKEALLVDAPEGVAQYVAQFLEEEGVKLVALLLTHGHWDHITDGQAIRSQGATVYAHKGDQAWLEDPAKMAVAMPPGYTIEPITIDEWLEEGQTLELMGQSIEVLHVPGHAPGCLAFYFPSLEIAFVGDAIFAGSIGRTDLPGGSFETLKASIKEKLYTLPDETMLCPGHGPATTVEDEKANNPFVKG